MIGTRDLELLQGIWDVQTGQLNPSPGDLSIHQENPIFNDLNTEEPDEESDDDSSSSSSSDQSDSSEDDANHDRLSG